MSATCCVVDLRLSGGPFGIDRWLLPVAHAVHGDISSSRSGIYTTHAGVPSVMVHRADILC